MKLKTRCSTFASHNFNRTLTNKLKPNEEILQNLNTILLERAQII